MEKQLSKDAKAKILKAKEAEKKRADASDPAMEPWFGVEEELKRIRERKAEEGLSSDSEDSDSEEEDRDRAEEQDVGGDSEEPSDGEDMEDIESRREDEGNEQLSRRARQFFDNPLFKDVLGSLQEGRSKESEPKAKRTRAYDSDEGALVEKDSVKRPKKSKKKDTKVVGAGSDSEEEFIKNVRKNRKELRRKKKAGQDGSDDEEGEEGKEAKNTFETVPVEADVELSDMSDDEETLGTAGAITAALALARGGRKAKRDLIDASYNRYAFNDQKGALPRWFLDDEGKHNKPQLPISKEAVQLIRDRAKQLDARPIKKIAEAKGRKKYRAMKRLQKMSAEIGKIWEDDDPGTTEMQKLRTIQKVAAKAAKGKGLANKREKPKLVVAKGKAKGVQGRPKGVKGRYKVRFVLLLTWPSRS